MKSGKAFTLIELMMVIAIIGILAALLLPALSRSKETARRVACQSNLRQSGLGMSMYTDETGFFPALRHWDTNVHRFVTYGWQAQLLPYASGNTRVFKCPSTSHEFSWPTNRSELGFPFPYNIGNSTPFSYGYNGWGVAAVEGLGLGVVAQDPIPAGSIAKPSDMIGIGDSGGTAWISFHRLLSTPIKPPGKRHREGANIVFVDGHVEWQNQTNWTALNEAAARRWNNDNLPHRDLWISGGR